ncbi:MAG TPA: PadR family transcriptional regulator [Acidimicrobiales bacterium]|nr:PadR family transcriptional regulator [Acidimicrobiales bacterium]
MPRRSLSNPLALAVLACLYERAMHPYEMATTMRSRGKDESIKLNYGSLYSVVEALERGGLIEAQETTRQGRRPERTVYRITDEGARELLHRLSALLSTPVKEYTQFEAGLSYLPVVTPADALTLLQTRLDRLEMELTGRRSVHAHLDGRLPRLFSLEYEYKTALLEAELAWVRAVVGDIESGALEGSELWAGFHAEEGTAAAVTAAAGRTTDARTQGRKGRAP